MVNKFFIPEDDTLIVKSTDFICWISLIGQFDGQNTLMHMILADKTSFQKSLLPWVSASLCFQNNFEMPEVKMKI